MLHLRAGMLVLLTGLGAVVGGCGLVPQYTGLFDLTSLFNPELFSNLGLPLIGTRVASLPGDAPGLLVAVENQTDRWVSMVVAYRDGEDEVQTYTTVVAPGDKSAQMLNCPIKELTLGDVTNLDQPGVLLYLVENADVAGNTDILDQAPYIEVDPFGMLLLDGVNYECGDGVTFTVRANSQASSGYRTFAFIRRDNK